MLTFLEGKDIQQIRDRAILLVGFYGALRRSELAGIDVEDLKFTRLGLLITLRKSKTDQFDQGQMIAIPMVKDTNLCAVTALKNWLDMSGITTGPVFRGLTKGHHIRKTRISDKAIALIVKHYAELMGMNPDDYGAHSLRHALPLPPPSTMSKSGRSCVRPVISPRPSSAAISTKPTASSTVRFLR